MSRKNTIKIMLLCLLITVIVFAAVICISYIPRRVQHVLSGVELLMTSEDDFELLRVLDIRIDGRLHYGMFANQPRFRGLIEIDGYVFTFGNEVDIWFNDDFSNGSLMYIFAEFSEVSTTSFGTIPRIETLGWIDTDRYFSYVVIRVYEWESHSDGGRVSVNTNRIIVAPAADINSALELF